MKIILASGSSRRRKLLSESGYDFEVMVPGVLEKTIPGESPADHVIRLSNAKALAIARDNRTDLVIGADTIVVLNDTILGKPESERDAIGILKKLSGKTHIVYTGLTLMILGENIIKSDYDSTRVIFNDLGDDQIRRYIESGEPLDKAGAYGIQGMGSFLVNRYDGELDTVIGFPTRLFKKIYGEVFSCLNR